MSKETGGPAFPNNFVYPKNQGMTLRDYFAAKAMQAIIGVCPKNLPDEDLAIDSYKVADAMLKAREQ
jgi:hypothetical protein